MFYQLQKLQKSVSTQEHSTGDPSRGNRRIGGGLEALTAILRALPTDIAMAFMLIQHLDLKRHCILSCFRR
jgi:chemotaxis response regulator CheB